MLKKLMISAVVGALSLATATVASAATLSVNGGTTVTLNSDFSLNSTTGLSAGTQVTLFDGAWWNLNGVPNTGGSGGFGLQLDGAPVNLAFEYLGSEAADHNLAIYSGSGAMFDNSVSTVGDTVVQNVGSNGLVPFYFQNHEGWKCHLFGQCDSAPNTGDIDWHLSLAFYEDTDGSYIALFGDGSGDFDLDDMAIRISVVPLPPAVALFAGALFGLGWLSRRRKAAAAA